MRRTVDSFRSDLERINEPGAAEASFEEAVRK